MTRDELRTARLLFALELADGTLRDEALRGPAVEEAVVVRPVPSTASRLLQNRALRSGRLDVLGHGLAPSLAARRALLGEAAFGPPRVLLRLDGLPRPGDGGFAAALLEIHGELDGAGVPYVVPARASELDEADQEALWRVRRDGAAVAVQADSDGATAQAGLTGLRALGLEPAAFVPEHGTLSWRRWAGVAGLFDVVAGGEAEVRTLGFHPPLQARGDAVLALALAPFAGPADVLAAAVEALADAGAALWVPAAIDAGAELAGDRTALRRLAALLGTGVARPWEDVVAAAELAAGP